MTIDYKEITIEDADFIPWNDIDYDPARMSLIVPVALLAPYGGHVGLAEKANKLWKALDLRNHWQECKEKKYHTPIPDILEFMQGSVLINYQLFNGENPTHIRLLVYEQPKRVIA